MSTKDCGLFVCFIQQAKLYHPNKRKAWRNSLFDILGYIFIKTPCQILS